AAYPYTGFPELVQICLHLLPRERLDKNGTLQAELLADGVVVCNPTAYGQRQKKTMLLAKVVDRFYTRRSMLFFDFIESIQQRKYPVMLDPRLRNFLGHVITLREFVD